MEYECLKQNDLFSAIKNAIAGDIVTVLVHNLSLLPRHIDDIVSYNRMIYNDIIGFTETQIKPPYSTFKITEMLNFFQY